MKSKKSFLTTFISQNYLYFILFFLLIISYWNIIIKDVVLEYDDKNLINALLSTSGIKTYLLGIKEGLIFDIQPVRDLSYLIDITLKESFSYSFHLTNVLIWLGICIVFHKILILETKKTLIANVLILIICFSPVASSSVAWIAARKHLLSTFFILISTYLVLKLKNDEVKPKDFIWINLLYLLSCFSQPINALWPVWLAFYLYFQQNLKKNKVLLLCLFSIMALVLSLNMFYYSTIYVDKIGLGNKFRSDHLDMISTALAMGRYFYLSIFPFSALPTSHSRDAWENIVGLISLVLSVGFIFKYQFENKKKVIVSLIYFALPLFIVSIRPTNIFCSDTYLLNSSLGLYLAIGYCASPVLNSKKALGGLILYGLFLFVYNLNYINVFSGDEVMWKYSQEKEANAQSTMIVAMGHMKKNDFVPAYVLIDEIQAKWPESPFIPQLISESIFFNDKLSNQKKIEIIEKVSSKTPATYFYLSILYARENSQDNLKISLENFLNNRTALRMEFKGKEERVSAIFYYTCRYFKIQNCETNSMHLKEQFQKNNFDESFYRGYLQYLFSRNDYFVNLKI